MATLATLPATAYTRPQNVRGTNKMLRERRPRHVQAPSLSDIADVTDEEDFPTPRGIDRRRLASPNPSERSVSESSYSGYSDYSNERRFSTSSSSTDFDSLYDVSDTDSAFVPLQVSNSIKKNLDVPKIRYQRRSNDIPSLVIPSPREWPTIQKYKSATSQAHPMRTPLSPDALAKLNVCQTLRVPGQSSTPSLAESMISDEPISVSPSTPAGSHIGEDQEWEMPIQLHPEAMDTLQQLSLDADQEEPISQVIELSQAQAHEMQDRGLNINFIIGPAQTSSPSEPAEEPISAISVPSPGGFFASLASPTQRLWNPTSHRMQEGLSTSTAENFYNVPWDPRLAPISDRIIEVAETESNGPPTARKDSFPKESDDNVIVDELYIPADREYEYDEQYDAKLHQEATTNMSRTSVWLSAQDNYLSALKNTNPTITTPPPTITSFPKSVMTPPATANSPPRSKDRSVRFAQPVKRRISNLGLPKIQTIFKQHSGPLFYHAFQHLIGQSSHQTAFTHRGVRSSALSAQRLYLSALHRRQLRSSFALADPVTQGKDYSHLPDAPEDVNGEVRREELATADRERQALQQLTLAAWTLQATRFLNHGALLPHAATAVLARCRDAARAPRILDLCGAPTADWGWAMAMEQRDARVQTLVPDCLAAFYCEAAGPASHRGPSNHRVIEARNTWILPFEDNSFDVVSARALHMALRTTAAIGADGRYIGLDEWDATLVEVKRILAPGGVFCFETMDAEVVGLGGEAVSSALGARSVEFAGALKGRGYDGTAGHRMGERCRRAGLVSGASGAMVGVTLPAGCGKDDDGRESGIDAVTGLIGSVGWERWMLKLQLEMGRPEERLLDGVARALESGKGAAWKVWRGVVAKVDV